MQPSDQVIFHGIDHSEHLLRIGTRLAAAMLLGGVMGYERQREGKTAGVRTHGLVALGAALFVIFPLESGLSMSDLSRVIQGLVAGIGFLGAGTILKVSDHEIRGLNTAASIWLTAAVGVSVGAGWLWPAITAVFLAWCLLAGMHLLDPPPPRKNGQ